MKGERGGAEEISEETRAENFHDWWNTSTHRIKKSPGYMHPSQWNSRTPKTKNILKQGERKERLDLKE